MIVIIRFPTTIKKVEMRRSEDMPERGFRVKFFAADKISQKKLIKALSFFAAI